MSRVSRLVRDDEIGVINTNFSYIVAAFDHSILDAPGAYIADSNVAEKAPHAQPQVSGGIARRALHSLYIWLD